MRLADKINSKVQKLLALAEQYDQSGQYTLADKIYLYLKNYYFDILPTETKLRITQNSPHAPQSMSSTEPSRGYVPVRYNPDAYASGKGQAAFKSDLPMNKEFV